MALNWRGNTINGELEMEIVFYQDEQIMLCCSLKRISLFNPILVHEVFIINYWVSGKRIGRGGWIGVEEAFFRSSLLKKKFECLSWNLAIISTPNTRATLASRKLYIDVEKYLEYLQGSDAQQSTGSRPPSVGLQWRSVDSISSRHS